MSEATGREAAKPAPARPVRWPNRRSPTLRRLMVALLVVMTIGVVLGVTVLAYDILVAARGVTATVLLGRGAAIWVGNVIVFSLWYCEFDRGGPAERAAGAPVPPSFAFPENATPELAPPGWRPAYPDYLYLAFTNATAFSPTTPSRSGAGPS